MNGTDPKATAAEEINFDGLVGPTHNFAGLAPGNLASMDHRNQTSNPRAAAKQGLEKMRLLRDLGVPQAVLPPQPRPCVRLLHRLGFAGTDRDVLEAAGKHAPELLAIASSGSSMWTANAATVAPSADTADGRVHFTPANLLTSLHRANETATTSRILRRVFADPDHFVHHQPLPGGLDFADEGAANHTRFARSMGEAGVHLFVYGRDRGDDAAALPKRFPARQTKSACESLARLHGLAERRTVFARQHLAAIDAGVFHNDVIAVGHLHRLLYHEQAFENATSVLDELAERTDGQLQPLKVTSQDLSVENAVRTYLFNSQIVSPHGQGHVLVAPQQCRNDTQTAALIERWLDDGSFDEVHFVEVGQSMNNGGGPACLRLRVVLTAEERDAISSNVLLTDGLLAKLDAWIERHYRDELAPGDLADVTLLEECRRALDELTDLLGLGSVYDFQRTGGEHLP